MNGEAFYPSEALTNKELESDKIEKREC